MNYILTRRRQLINVCFLTLLLLLSEAEMIHPNIRDFRKIYFVLANTSCEYSLFHSCY